MQRSCLKETWTALSGGAIQAEGYQQWGIGEGSRPALEVRHGCFGSKMQAGLDLRGVLSAEANTASVTGSQPLTYGLPAWRLLWFLPQVFQQEDWVHGTAG